MHEMIRVCFLCRYPQLLNRSYVDSVFSFRTTQKRRAVKRCIGSALYISSADGVGGRDWGIGVLVMSEHSVLVWWIPYVQHCMRPVGIYRYV